MKIHNHLYPNTLYFARETKKFLFLLTLILQFCSTSYQPSLF